jgi:hypothetical protein
MPLRPTVRRPGHGDVDGRRAGAAPAIRRCGRPGAPPSSWTRHALAADLRSRTVRRCEVPSQVPYYTWPRSRPQSGHPDTRSSRHLRDTLDSRTVRQHCGRRFWPRPGSALDCRTLLPGLSANWSAGVLRSGVCLPAHGWRHGRQRVREDGRTRLTGVRCGVCAREARRPEVELRSGRHVCLRQPHPRVSSQDRAADDVLRAREGGDQAVLSYETTDAVSCRRDRAARRPHGCCADVCEYARGHVAGWR